MHSYTNMRQTPTCSVGLFLYIAMTVNKDKETAMSDEADIADDEIEHSRLAAIEACRRKTGIIPKGSCWYCEEELTFGQKFCDRDCAADYEAEQAALLRNGRFGGLEASAD